VPQKVAPRGDSVGGVKAAKITPPQAKLVMGRPRLKIANRPEECPRGHEGGIILWGTREWTTAPFRRQRFRCSPSDGSPEHTFSLGRRRAADHHPAGEECVTCDIKPGVAQGPISPSDYFHTAVEIAHLLQLVGQGMSLRRASLTVRLEAHRFWQDAHGMRHASRQHALAARYLDLFGTAIDARLAPTRCPKILILDSKPLNLRAYGAEDFDPTWNTTERGGAVLVAVGGDDPDHRAMPWRIGLAPDETTRSWLDFLDEIDPEGEGPEWVVADWIVFGEPWGFSVADVAQPVHIWEGGADAMAVPAGTEYLTRTIPRAALTTFPDAGHAALIPHWAEMLSALA